MGSSEIVESGRLAGQKSTFAQTCSLLSQYLKENGSLGDLSLGLSSSRSFEPLHGAPAKTMDLLPMIEKNNSEAKIPVMTPASLFPNQAGFLTQKMADIRLVKSEPETAPMTIFYGGQVLVFNDLPADKAREIMLLAGQGISSPDAFTTFTDAAHVVPETALTANVNDLPIARKASLTRFLAKRKDRISAKAPYSVGGGSKAVERKPAVAPWMGFGGRFPANPLQMQRR